MQCKVCGKEVIVEKTPKFRLISDENQRYEAIIHPLCWDSYIEDEARKIVIKTKLKEKGLMLTSKQVEEIPNREELTDFLFAGREIEWAYEINYSAEIFDLNEAGALSFLNNYRDNLLNLSTIKWTPKWQVVE